MKLAIVVQRYGPEITGGSEHLCRMIAERLAQKHEVDMLTTCAKDYITWKNEYPQGRSTLNGVYVYRFPVTKERDLQAFNRFSEQLYYKDHTTEDELRWLEEQGPLCPGLIDYLRAVQRTYDRILFFTYLYYPTYYGLQVAPQKSVLIPTAHDEPAIRLGIFREVFARPYAFLFNTESEKEFASSLFSLNRPQKVAGIGVDIPQHTNRRRFKHKQGLIEDYFYYGGRIDAGKGCQELIDFYLRKRKGNPDFPLLFFSGHLGMELPRDPSVIYLGYLSEIEKQEALQGALCVIIPSVMESLSILILEAFAARTPALVRENSPVLKDHCLKSNAGIFYSDYDEFSACVDYMMDHPHMRHHMGLSGQRYVQRNYTWPRIISAYEEILSMNPVPPFGGDLGGVLT